MEPVEYKIKKNRNIHNQEINYDLSEANRVEMRDKDKQKEKKFNLKEFIQKYKIFLIVAIVLIIVIIIIAIVVPLKIKKNKDDKVNPDLKGEEDQNINQNSNLNIELAKEIFSPSFKIISKVDTLTQLSQKSYQSYENIKNGQKTSTSILSKVLYDIYTINSTSSSKNDEIFYSNKYTTVITVNSLCANTLDNSGEINCELEKYLDLNKRENNNLRRNEENEEELIREAILPICIIEHTDTNLIISLTCPETLETGFKNDIIRAFQNIKPDSMKGYDFDKNYVDTILEENDDKIYITYFDNICKDPNTDPSKNIICNLTKNIVTDKEGNLISSRSSTIEKTEKDENNIFSNNFTYEFENIPQEESQSFNKEAFKSNLNYLIPIISPIMKKDIFINNFTDYALDLMQEEPDQNITKLRNLEEENSSSRGVHEEIIFNHTFDISEITFFFNLKNDIGLNGDKIAKAISYINVNNENDTDLSNNMISSNLADTLNKFINISKSGNNLANDLYEKFNEPLLSLEDIISSNIKKINDILAYKDLSKIFDSSSAIDHIEKLDYQFVVASKYLYDSMNQLKDDLLYIMDNAKKTLKNDITSFLQQSHNLIFELFNKLTEVTNALSGDKSKIAEIASYYLNYTDTSYYKSIKNATNILENYYKNEKQFIYPLVSEIFSKFYNNSIKCIENYQVDLDKISERLNDGNLTIALASLEDYQKTISNIYNTKQLAYEIVETIKSTFENSINLQPNGYFETQNEIDNNNKTYGKINERALSIAYSLDKNELIDKTFDSIMTTFREKFITLLEYMDESIETEFSLQENVLSSSLFEESYDNATKQFFDNEENKMITFIKDENTNFSRTINNTLNSFKNENGKGLDDIISELLSELTPLYLYNLNMIYNDSITLAYKSINQVIENNKKKAFEYLNDSKISSSYHITTGFKNKYNIFYNSFIEIENFVNKNLRNNLAIKYKNVINQIRSLLQSIKANKILQKYYKQLPTAENHLNSIKFLFEIFEKNFSDSTYNDNYFLYINNITTKLINNTNQIKQNLQNRYNSISKKKFNNIQQDYDVERIIRGSRYCCKKAWYGKCKRHCYYPDTYLYDGYNVIGTNNHFNLEKINFEEYTKKFDEKYNQLYPNFLKNILSYNDLLTKLDTNIESKKNDLLKTENKYINNIPQKVESLLAQYYGNNLLQSSYNFFKNKITNKLPNILDGIKTQFANVIDNLYEEINLNKNNFKSSLDEFFYVATYYTSTYAQNISYDYGELIVDKLKNEFNYTNKYYYNKLISQINNTYNYILGNLPKNEKPFDEILNKRINEIKKEYEKILIKIKNSENEILDKGKQQIILQVNEKNFFLINDVISTHINSFNTLMNEKIENLISIADENYIENSEELLAAKFYLENSINGKQINDIFKIIDSSTFIDLKNNDYEKLIDETWFVDKDGFINNISNILTELNEKNNNNFKYEKEKYIELLKDKLYSEFYKKEELDRIIISFYEDGINNLFFLFRNKSILIL